jgi:hypothetical protein
MVSTFESSDYYIILKHGINIWVQFRKEDQILMPDLNPYWVIFKLLMFPRWLWDPGISVRDLFCWESRCSPVRYQRCFATSAQWSWQFCLRSIGYRVLVLSFGVFIWELCCPFRLSQPRQCWPMLALYFIVYFGMYIIFGLFYLFILLYARLVVRTWRD